VTLLNKLAILDGYLFDEDNFLNSFSLYNKSPTAVEYRVFPLKSSSPFILFGEPILDGVLKNDSEKLSSPSSFEPPPVKTSPALILFE